MQSRDATHGDRPLSAQDLPERDRGEVTFSPIRAQRAADWEISKGHLRALVAANSAIRGPVVSRAQRRAFALSVKVDEFIAAIEAEELYIAIGHAEQDHVSEGQA